LAILSWKNVNKSFGDGTFYLVNTTTLTTISTTPSQHLTAFPELHPTCPSSNLYVPLPRRLTALLSTKRKTPSRLPPNGLRVLSISRLMRITLSSLQHLVGLVL